MTMTVIIPAHNEAAVIGSTLSSLLRDARPGDFRVVVVCNGCTDGTAPLVRSAFPDVTVVELDESSRVAAINAGLHLAGDQDVLLLDADVELATRDALALCDALTAPGIDVAIGRMKIDVEGGSWPVRAFYRVWALHPYLANGKFAAAIAISKSALHGIGELPGVTNDDAYLSRLFRPENVALVYQVCFRVRVPRSLPALLRVRSRIHRGNRELQQLFPDRPEAHTQSGIGLLRIVSRRPRLWVDFVLFVAVGGISRLLSLRPSRGWERDLTSRQVPSQG